MGIISNDADEGLVTSLLMYVGALAAVLLVLGTPVYLLNMPQHTENHGLAVYQAPRGTRLLPEPNRQKRRAGLESCGPVQRGRQRPPAELNAARAQPCAQRRFQQPLERQPPPGVETAT